MHVGGSAAQMLLNDESHRVMLDQGCISMLEEFLQRLGGSPTPERTHALLGQSYLKHTLYCQLGEVL